jgi:hypothetical protein
LSRLRRDSWSRRSPRFASICWMRRLASRALRELAAKDPPVVSGRVWLLEGMKRLLGGSLPRRRPPY